MKNKAVLLLSCKDRTGLVSRIANFIFERNGNILDLDEHVDREKNHFSIRVAFDTSNLTIEKEQLSKAFAPLGDEFSAKWEIKFTDKKTKTAIFVSKYDHCLQEILWRYSSGELFTEIPLIISNHPDLEYLAKRYDIPFYLFSVNKSNKEKIEQEELELLKSKDIDSIVLARYMQILSPDFVKNFANNIINIHHSFLPAFAGGDPYGQAFKRGVKIIGATSHYVTNDLDEGPIIEQDIIKISHRDSIDDLKRKGRDLERIVLAKALELHLNNSILVNDNKTVIFE